MVTKKKKVAKPKQLSKAELKKAQKAQENEEFDALFGEMDLDAPKESKNSKKAQKKAAQKAKAAAAAEDATTCDDLSKNSSEFEKKN